MSKSKLFKRTVWIVCSVILLLILSGIGCGAYFFFSPNFMPEKTAYVYIYPEKDYADLCRQLEDSAKRIKKVTLRRLIKKRTEWLVLNI